jgi:hypothetical protein
MATIYNKSGYDGSAIVWYPNQPTRERNGNIWGYVWKGWAADASLSADGLVPADGVGMDASPTNVSGKEGYKLTSAKVSETSIPGRVDIELTYAAAGGAWIRREPGDIERRVEVIQLSRDRVVAVSDVAGPTQETVTFAGLRYTYSEYVETPDEWTEAQIVTQSGIGINKLGAPTGIDEPTENKWIFRGAEIQETDGLARRTEVWEYSPIGWDETDPA